MIINGQYFKDNSIVHVSFEEDKGYGRSVNTIVTEIAGKQYTYNVYSTEKESIEFCSILDDRMKRNPTENNLG